MASGPNLIALTEGWTEPIVQRVLNDGVALSLVGIDVSLVLQTADGTVIDTTGKVDNLDDATEANKGKVSFSPSSTDLVVASSPYYWKWKLIDSGGKIAYCPNDQAARLKVYPQGKA